MELTARKAGTLNISVSVKDNGVTRSAKLKIVIVAPIIEWHIESANGSNTLGAGKTLQMNAYVNGGAKPSNSAVDWRLWYDLGRSNPVPAEVAAISATGKISAGKSINVRDDFYVTATPKSGANDPERIPSFAFSVQPLATGVSILRLSSPPNNETTNVTGQTLTLDRFSESAGTIALLAAVEPMLGELSLSPSQQVKWSSSNVNLVVVDPSEGGGEAVLRIADTELARTKGGTVTVTATAMDGSGKKASIKVTVTEIVHVLHINVPVGLPEFMGRTVMASNASLKLTPYFGEGSSPTNQKLRWWIDPVYAAYASVSAAGVVKAKKLSDYRIVKVRCQSLDPASTAAEAEVELCIVPAVASVEVSNMYGEICNGKTLTLDAGGIGDRLDVSVNTLPQSVHTFDVEVKSSNERAVTVTPAEPGRFTLTAVGKGSSTVTFKSTDGNGAKTTIKVVAAQLADGVKVTLPNGTQAVDSGQLNIAAGKSVQLKGEAVCLDAGRNVDAGRKPANTKVLWSIAEPEARSFASISSSGKLTVKAGYEQQSFSVSAVPAAGIPYVETMILCTVKPAVSSVRIFEDVNDSSGDEVPIDRTGATVLVEPNTGSSTFYTGISPDFASNDIMWTVNNKAVTLKVDEYGAYVDIPRSGVKNGTVITLTAKATDGSGKSASVKLKVAKSADYIVVSDPYGQINVDESYHGRASLTLAAGKSIQLKGVGRSTLDGWTPANTKVLWSTHRILDRESTASQYGSVSSAGKVSAAANAAGHVFYVLAAPAGGYGGYCMVEVTVVEPVDALRFVNTGDHENVYTSAAPLPVARGTTQLDRLALVTAPSGSQTTYIVTSSNPKVTVEPARGTVSSSGADISLRLDGSLKLNTVITLTARATDGSNKTAVMKLKIGIAK